MLDVFVVVLLVGMVRFGVLASVEPEAGLLAFGAVRPDGNALASDLDLDVRLRDQVVVPAGVLRRPALRRDHRPGVAIGNPEQRRGARLARLPSDGAQQQHRTPAEVGADAAVADLVQPLVDAEQRRENGLDERMHVATLASVMQ
jgi:hypothetical protein